MKNYRKGLAVDKFVNALHPEIAVQLHGVVLGGDTLPKLSNTFYQAQCFVTRVAPSPTNIPLRSFSVLTVHMVVGDVVVVLL